MQDYSPPRQLSLSSLNCPRRCHCWHYCSPHRYQLHRPSHHHRRCHHTHHHHYYRRGQRLQRHPRHHGPVRRRRHHHSHYHSRTSNVAAAVFMAEGGTTGSAETKARLPLLRHPLQLLRLLNLPGSKRLRPLELGEW